MINRDLFEQLERIKADECSYMIYKMLKARPELSIKDIELVQDSSGEKISFYVQERTKPKNQETLLEASEADQLERRELFKQVAVAIINWDYGHVIEQGKDRLVDQCNQMTEAILSAADDYLASAEFKTLVGRG